MKNNLLRNTIKEGKKLTTGKYTAEIKVMVIEDDDEKNR